MARHIRAMALVYRRTPASRPPKQAALGVTPSARFEPADTHDLQKTRSRRERVAKRWLIGSAGTRRRDAGKQQHSSVASVRRMCLPLHGRWQSVELASKRRVTYDEWQALGRHLENAPAPAEGVPSPNQTTADMKARVRIGATRCGCGYRNASMV